MCRCDTDAIIEYNLYPHKSNSKGKVDGWRWRRNVDCIVHVTFNEPASDWIRMDGGDTVNHNEFWIPVCRGWRMDAAMWDMADCGMEACETGTLLWSLLFIRPSWKLCSLFPRTFIRPIPLAC